MTKNVISLEQVRQALSPSVIVERLMRDGYEEQAVYRAISKVQANPTRDLTMVDILIGARRQLLLESRITGARRR